MLWILKHTRLVSISGLLFLFFFSLYALTIYGRLRYGDEMDRYFQAQSLVDRQSLAIRQIPSDYALGADGKTYYSQFELGYGLLLIPPYFVGRVVSTFFPYGDRDWIPVIFVGLVNPLITALTCVVLFQFSRMLGVRPSIAIWITVIFGLATLALPYTRGVYREATQTFTLLLSVYALYAFRCKGDQKWLWISGIAFGYLAFTKVSNLAMIPIFLAYILGVRLEGAKPGNGKIVVGLPHRMRALVPFLIPVLLLLGIQGVVNVIKFGDFFDIGPYNYRYPLGFFSLSNLPTAVVGLLFSSSKSLFLYSPPAVLFFAGWWTLFRRSKVDAFFLFALILVNIIYYGAYNSWDGGNYWGPRYFVLIVPLMIVPFGLLLESARGWKRWLALGFSAVIFLIGLSVQIGAALVGDREYLDATGHGIQLFGALDFLRHRAIDSLFVYFDPQSGGIRLNPYALVILLLFLFLGVWLCARVLSNSQYRASRRHDITALATGIAIIAAGLITQVVAVYPQVLRAKGNTQYVAANFFYSDGRYCESQSFYLNALSLGTENIRETIMRLEQISPRAQGKTIEIGDLLPEGEPPNPLEIGYDSQRSIAGEDSLKIRAPAGQELTGGAATQFLSIRPNAQYDLSGWITAEGIYGSGYAVVGWYEDDGNWRNSRSLDVASAMDSNGWQPFRQTITTLPTTRRVLLKAGLWQAYGTMWVDGLRLVQVEDTDSLKTLCAQ